MLYGIMIQDANPVWNFLEAVNSLVFLGYIVKYNKMQKTVLSWSHDKDELLQKAGQKIQAQSTFWGLPLVWGSSCEEYGRCCLLKGQETSYRGLAGTFLKSSLRSVLLSIEIKCECLQCLILI